jgi:ketosteroid isomerase-like protein
MSRENVELARKAFDAINRRHLADLLALMDDEVHAESRLVVVEGGYRGHEGMRRWWIDLFGGFPDFAVEIQETQDLGDVVLARIRDRGHSAASDIPLSDVRWHLSGWREGKCVWWRVCTTEAEALEAASLRERG